VFGCPDILEKGLSLLAAPSDLAECACVNRAFRAASDVVGVALVSTMLPAAAAAQACGALELRGGLGRRIASELAHPLSTKQDLSNALWPLPFPARIPFPPVEDYYVMLRVRTDSGVVCFSAGDTMSSDARGEGQVFANALQVPCASVGLSKLNPVDP
jgi:hypothetical protein